MILTGQDGEMEMIGDGERDGDGRSDSWTDAILWLLLRRGTAMMEKKT